MHFLYLFLRQIARRVGGPDIARDGLGAGPEVSAADLEPAARGAAPLHVRLLVLQLREEFIGRVESRSR